MNFRLRFIEPFLLSEHPPWFDARGVALGLLAGFGFPLGLQWISLGLLRLGIRFNVILALAFTWVNNPLTVAPMYYGYYKIGASLIGGSSRVSSETFVQLMSPMFNADGFLESFYGLGQIGSDILIRWSIGAAITGLFFGVSGYIFTYFVQSYRRQKRGKPV